MEIRILGLLEVTAAGHGVPLPATKVRALLAMLVLNAGTVVPVDRLVDALWGEEATASSTSSLRLHVSHLRRALGTSAVVTRSPGYLLAVDPSSIDACRFERMAREGRRALDVGDVAGAVATLGEALALWRGPALADFRYAEFAQSEAARLEELRLVATEDLADAQLASGRHAEAASRLQVLVDQHPLRERLWGSLMLALYRCGRQAEALRAYQALRQVLGRELAIEPSRSLQRLEEAILLQSPDLDLDLEAVAGSGSGGARGVPLPSRLTAEGQRAVFVGREDQLALLGAALDEVRASGQRRVVLIGGEPGIGKTTLVSEFARAAHDGGAIVLYGRCDEGVGIPYQPWAAALAHLLDHAPSGRVRTAAAAQSADLARLGPDVAALVGAATANGGSAAAGPVASAGADPETARRSLFGAVLRLLEAASHEQPIVLVLDDLQWADVPSLALLRHVVGSDRSVPVVVAGTFRDSEVGAKTSLADVLASLRRESGVTRVGLWGLNDAELLALLEAGTGGAFEGDVFTLRDALARETNGNPFFAGELLRHAVETGLICRDPAGHWVVTGNLREQALPASLREVVGQRVARLGDEAVRALSAAAVIGRDFDLPVVAVASGTDDETLLDLLDAAVAARLVVNVAGERFSFVHALVQHALYDSLNPARRARAHRRAADAIEALCGPGGARMRAGELASHHIRAESAGDREKALHYAALAGDHALAQLAPDEALRWYRQALDLLDEVGQVGLGGATSATSVDDGRLRARLLVGLGDAQRQTGDAAFRPTLHEAVRLAQSNGDTDTVVAAVLADNRGTMTRTGLLDLERVAMIEAALAAIPEGDSPLRARLLSLLALELIGDQDHARRRSVADEALAMARRLDDPATQLEVLIRRHQSIRTPDTLAERLANTAEALELAAVSRDPLMRFWAAQTRLMSVADAGDLATFVRCQDQVSTLAAAIDQPTPKWIATFSRCARLLLAGDTAGAEAAAADTLRLGTESGQPDVATIHAAQLLVIRWQQGRQAELMESFATKAAALPQLPALRAALARMYADIGLPDEARELLKAEHAAGFPHPRDYLELSYLASLAETAAELGERDIARSLYDSVARWPGQVVFVQFVFLGATDHYLGLLATVLGRFDDAEAHLARAEEIHARLEAPFLLARTHLAYGAMLRARDGQGRAAVGEACSRFETARKLADAYGCAHVSQRARMYLDGSAE